MEQLLITSNEQLCKWLSEWHWFTEQHIRALSPPPALANSNSKPPADISFQFTQKIRGTHFAGEQNIQRSFELKATGVEEWSRVSKLDENYCGYVYIQDVDVPISGDKLKIVIDDIKLTCSEIKIPQRPPRPKA